jgi:predicted O-linked N-acetylglucosamine transferase (SPINDLY family)
MNGQQQIRDFWVAANYDAVIIHCEDAINSDNFDTFHYLYLGLAYLLQGQEAAAQTTWMFAIMQNEEETEKLTQNLVDLLKVEAQQNYITNNFQTSWLIRQHIRSIVPNNIHNLLSLIQLEVELDTFFPQAFADLQIIELLQQDSVADIDSDLLLKVISKVLNFPAPETLKFLEACLPYAQPPEVWARRITDVATTIGYQPGLRIFASKILEICLKISSNNVYTLRQLSFFYTDIGCHQNAIETTQKLFENCHSLDWQLSSSHLIVRALISSGDWFDIKSIAERHNTLMLDIIQNQPEEMESQPLFDLISAPYLSPYLQDNARENRWFQNEIAQLFQKNLKIYTPSIQPPNPSNLTKSPKLKIGYIAHTLKIHSVGWLSRWLFHHHNREDFQTYIYFVNQNSSNEFSQKWFKEKVDYSYTSGINSQEVAEQINKDGIDILVDLDSATYNGTCMTMAFKPAPVQVTWLGWDASGLPAIDYYIADPYVLPDNAQDYYQETIWRLPQTYIAVDGFEVDTPTLRRDLLDIPSDAVIFLSAQRGFKRHPDTARLQLKIIKEVPNSYFLIKGLSDQATVQEFFFALAEEEGVEPDRLRFLPMDRNEYVHRANLQIADIVLDTYPYNGATTTLETLWMGIPLVTRVGEQFAARNSYAFLMNVGVTEGIAWTDEEYIEWGVRLAKDEALRQQVAWKLRASRQTSPLWNAKQFTREMENAYQQMWLAYLEST